MLRSAGTVRGGTTTATWTAEIFHAQGDVNNLDCVEDPSLKSLAWYADNSDLHPHAVEGLAPNPLGLFDMLGNVAEMTTNLDNGNGYGEGPLVNPIGHRNSRSA